MPQIPPSKGMKPVSSSTMLNFLNWLTTYHPEVRSLQYLPDADLLNLVKEFERSRPDITPATPQEWFRGFEQLSKN